VVDPERPIVVAARSRRGARCFGRLLQAAGLLDVRGYLAGGVASWQEQKLPIETTPALDASGPAERLRSDDVGLLDVRGDDEGPGRHGQGSLHVPFWDLRDGVPARVREAQDGKSLAVACSAGNRSSIAASLLRRAGVERVEHVADGG